MTHRVPVQADAVLRGCTRRWIDLLTGDGMLAELQTVLNTATCGRYLPPADMMFNFARYSLADTKVVILASDPYADSDAHGLAYSAARARCPRALDNIYAALIASGLLRARPDPARADPYSLWHLALQGVVLLNCAHTVEPNSPGSHIAMWQAWSDRLITRLSQAVPGGTVWCLWGADVQHKAALIDAGHTVLRAVHPINAEFVQCDHFSKIAARWPDLVWDVGMTHTVFYTDGASKNNQSRDSRAAWGVVCTCGVMAGRSWGERLQTVTIVGPIPKKSKTGVCNPHRVRADGRADVEARPTNIRAEGEAIIQALTRALTLPARVSCDVRTDSEQWIKMVTQYMPDWVMRGSRWESHANSDLCMRLWPVWERAQARGNITLTWVPCWHDRERPAGGQDLEDWLGNQAAERRAEQMV